MSPVCLNIQIGELVHQMIDQSSLQHNDGRQTYQILYFINLIGISGITSISFTGIA